MSDRYYSSKHLKHLRAARLRLGLYTCTVPGCDRCIHRRSHVVARRSGGADSLLPWLRIRCLCPIGRRTARHLQRAHGQGDANGGRPREHVPCSGVAGGTDGFRTNKNLGQSALDGRPTPGPAGPSMTGKRPPIIDTDLSAYLSNPELRKRAKPEISGFPLRLDSRLRAGLLSTVRPAAEILWEPSTSFGSGGRA